MTGLRDRVASFVRDESGVSIVEFALAVAVGAIGIVGLSSAMGLPATRLLSGFAPQPLAATISP